MKKQLLALLIAAIMVFGPLAAAAPQLSDSLVSAAMEAAGCLVSGEYERLVTVLPFSGVSPSAEEWERFARGFSSAGPAWADDAMAYWKGGSWRIAVPIQLPDSGDVEALLLQSEDGQTITGYKHTTWAQVIEDAQSGEMASWDGE